MTGRGRFISIEGIDGSGKSTQAGMLGSFLQSRGLEVLLTREPGGSPRSELIRELFLSEPWDPVSELMLFLASRREHLVGTVHPALAAGSWVVCDRFSDSTVAYQSHGRGLPEGVLLSASRFTSSGFQPHATVVLDLPVEDAASRLSERPGSGNRFDRESAAFAQRVRSGFLLTASRNSHRCRVVDASGGVDEVHEAVVAAVRDVLGSDLDSALDPIAAARV